MIIAMVLAAGRNRCFCSSVSNRGTNLAEISRTYKYSAKIHWRVPCERPHLLTVSKSTSLFFSDDIANSLHVSVPAVFGGTTLGS